MEAERLTRIETRLDRIDGQIVEIRADVAELRAEVDQLRTEVHALRAEVKELRTEVTELRAEVNELRAEVNELRRHMLVLHEDVIDRIAAIPDPTDWILREMRAGFADMREWVDRRLTPIELLIRQHDVDIRDLKQARPN